MKSFFSAFLFIVLLTGPATAANAPSIAVVDLEELSQQSKATQDLAAQVQAAVEAFQQSMSFKYEALQDELRSFRVEAAGMPARERTDRDAQIRQRIADLAAEEAEGLAAIDEQGAATMASLQGDFSAVTATVAENLGVDMILEKTTYDGLVTDGLAPRGAQDVTGLVLIFLDERVPTSGFAMPEQGATP